MFITDGTVDHYLCRADYPDIAYEWTNLRYCTPALNSSKRDSDQFLDPYKVEDGWFEVQLPSLELILHTDRVPRSQRQRAEYTLEWLGRKKRIRDLRAAWYTEFLKGEISLPNLRRKAPLLAAAVTDRLSDVSIHLHGRALTSLERLHDGTHTLKTLRHEDPRLATKIEDALQRPP